MRNLKDEFNILLARIDYFHLANVDIQITKSLKRNISPLSLESFGSNQTYRYPQARI